MDHQAKRHSDAPAFSWANVARVVETLRAALEAVGHEGEWTTQGEYGGERFTDEVSDSTYTDVLPVNGSWPEDIVCHVWGTERDDAKTAAFIAAANPEALRVVIEALDWAQAEVQRMREAER